MSFTTWHVDDIDEIPATVSARTGLVRLSAGDRTFTPSQARRLAAALTKAADEVDSRTTDPQPNPYLGLPELLLLPAGSKVRDRRGEVWTIVSSGMYTGTWGNRGPVYDPAAAFTSYAPFALIRRGGEAS